MLCSGCLHRSMIASYQVLSHLADIQYMTEGPHSVAHVGVAAQRLGHQRHHRLQRVRRQEGFPDPLPATAEGS